MTKPTPKPLETTLVIPGLRAPFTILQVTDLHACALGAAEAAAMDPVRRDYIPPRVALFSEGRPYPSEAALPVMFDYAAACGADLLLLTGDILDFPSEENLALLGFCLASAKTPTLYITGNHDWSFADDYHTAHSAAAYRPRIAALSGGDAHLAVHETGEVVVCALDNGCDRIPEETLSRYIAVARAARAAGKALILGMHIPLKVDTLVEDTVRVWRRDLCLGEGATGGHDPHTVAFWRAVTQSRDLAPDLVIAGHIHFDHEDAFPNGVPQLVTGIACDGHCRLIRLSPADPSPERSF